MCVLGGSLGVCVGGGGGEGVERVCVCVCGGGGLYQAAIRTGGFPGRSQRCSMTSR